MVLKPCKGIVGFLAFKEINAPILKGAFITSQNLLLRCVMSFPFFRKIKCRSNKANFFSRELSSVGSFGVFGLGNPSLNPGVGLL